METGQYPLDVDLLFTLTQVVILLDVVQDKIVLSVLKLREGFAQSKDDTSSSTSIQLLMILFPFGLGKVKHVHKVKILFLKCNSMISLSYMNKNTTNPPRDEEN